MSLSLAEKGETAVSRRYAVPGRGRVALLEKPSEREWELLESVKLVSGPYRDVVEITVRIGKPELYDLG